MQNLDPSVLYLPALPPRAAASSALSAFAFEVAFAFWTLSPGPYTLASMVSLHTTTVIRAPIARVFDLSRSIEVHVLGNVHFGEQATAGIRTGLIGMGEQITWQARHFFIRQHLTSAITAFDPPLYFQDTMLRGAFRSMQHDHYFRSVPTSDGTPATEMRDDFRFSAPLDPLGWISERLILRRYMLNLLTERNAVIQQVAESTEWQGYLPNT
jgi:ligand-binding SRPBCC domain-containing protein